MTDSNQQQNKSAFGGFSNNNLFPGTSGGLNFNNNQTTNTFTSLNNPSNVNQPFGSGTGFNLNPTNSNVSNSGTEITNKNFNVTNTNLNSGLFPNKPNDSSSTFNNTGVNKLNFGVTEPNAQKQADPFGTGDKKPFQFPSSLATNTTNNQAKPQEQNTSNKSVIGGGNNNSSMFGSLNSDKPNFLEPNATNSSSVLTFNLNSNGLDADKNNNTSNVPGNVLSGGNNLARSFSFKNPNNNLTSENPANQDKTNGPLNTNPTNLQTNPVTNPFTRLVENKTRADLAQTDKPNESTTTVTTNFQTNLTNDNFSKFNTGKTITNPAKLEETVQAQAKSSVFSVPQQPKETDAPKTNLFSVPKDDKAQKAPFSLNTTEKDGATNINSIFKSSTESGTNPTEKNTVSGSLFKTDSNTSNFPGTLGSKESNLGSKTNFNFGAKSEETNTSKDKLNETASFFDKDKKEGTLDTQPQNKVTFGLLNAKKEVIENTSSNTTKPVTNPNPSELFTSKTGTEAAKKDRKETDKKEESKIFFNLNLVKLSDPKEMPNISNSLQDVAINAIMKKSIEEVINHWKIELDNQVDRFDASAEKLKNFEFMFRKHFETIVSLYELISNLKEDADKTLRNLKDISLEEDQIIEQLNLMEKSLDQYLDIADNRESQGRRQQLDGRDHIYDTATDIAKTVDLIQKDIDDVNSKITEGNVLNKQENLQVMNYENVHSRESISMDKNEFTNILNSYYASLRSIQFMEQSLISKIMQAEIELNDMRRERERDKF